MRLTQALVVGNALRLDAGVLISGVLGGLGGIVYITAGVSEWKFEMGVAGFGFLALAVMIFGNWKPLNIAIVGFLFTPPMPARAPLMDVPR